MTTPTTSADSFALAAEKTRGMAGQVAMLAEGIRTGEVDQAQSAMLIDLLAWDVDRAATIIAASADLLRSYTFALAAYEAALAEIEETEAAA